MRSTGLNTQAATREDTQSAVPQLFSAVPQLCLSCAQLCSAVLSCASAVLSCIRIPRIAVLRVRGARPYSRPDLGVLTL